MSIGIERIRFYTPPFYLSLETLAKARGIDPDKYLVGLGQEKMAVIPPDESVVSMAANAAESILTEKDKQQIGMVLFATESGVDQSKAAGIYVHSLLGLPKHCRVLELKQACYSATGGLQLAYSWLAQHPKQKVLLLASDVARYGLNTPGEPSQGGGAIAMLLSHKPSILSIEPGSGMYTTDVMDFWRPNYRDEALVEGKYSCEIYLKALAETWDHYHSETQRAYDDHDQFIYHIPFPRLAEKAHQHLRTHLALEALNKTELKAALGSSLSYSRQTGNCYSGSLYLGLVSLLDQHKQDLSGQRIGCYSYGSGCVAEFFSLKVTRGYQDHLDTRAHKQMLKARRELSLAEYEEYYRYHAMDGEPNRELPKTTHGRFRFAGTKDHKPIYAEAKPLTHDVQAVAPGKIILSGEHAVVQGAPALVTAVNRYTTATVTPESEGLSLELKDLEHFGTATFDKLKQIKDRLQDAHQKFARGERGIRDVIQKPFELMQYTISHTLERFDPKRKSGFKVNTTSDIPIGCGMGSSAASIVSTNYAVTHFLGEHIDNKSQFELSLAAENLQHGRSSGIDLHVVMHGGCHWFEQGKAERCGGIQGELMILNTGEPSSTTGDCVSAATQKFVSDPTLTAQFSEVTEAVKANLLKHDDKGLIKAIKRNHQLLCQLGVVPTHVQTLIREIEQAGGAAKICGAGSISGDAAGIIWAVGDYKALKAIAKQQGYVLEKVQIESKGVALVTEQTA